VATVDADPVPELPRRQLELPVRDAGRQDLRDSFYEKRGADRQHEAIDIMTPRNTPIVAVEDGAIARLFESRASGTTVYQFAPANQYVYCYAHLDHDADGLKEEDVVRRGQLLGYVGTSGNASKDAPHLHFAIFRLTEKKQWRQGAPIDPYEVLRWLLNGRTPAADHADQEQHDGDDEQHMDERPDRIRPDDAEQPGDQQNHGDGVQHDDFPFSTRVPVPRHATTEGDPTD